MSETNSNLVGEVNPENTPISNTVTDTVTDTVTVTATATATATDSPVIVETVNPVTTVDITTESVCTSIAPEVPSKNEVVSTVEVVSTASAASVGQTTTVADVTHATPNSQKKGKAVKGAKVGGARRPNKRPAAKSPSAFNEVTKLLNEREYQTSKELPELGAVVLFSSKEKHMKLDKPTIRVSTQVRVLFLTGRVVEMSEEEKGKLVLPVVSGKEDLGENRNSRRFKQTFTKTMKNHVLTELSEYNLVRLYVQEIPYIVENAKVTRVGSGSNCVHIIWGEMKMSAAPRSSNKNNNLDDDDIPELTEPNAFEKAAGAFNIDVPLDTTDSTNAATADDDNFDIPEGSSITKNDVELIMSEANCTRREAINELVFNGGDLVNTIMAFTPDSMGRSPAKVRAQQAATATSAAAVADVENTPTTQVTEATVNPNPVDENVIPELTTAPVVINDTAVNTSNSKFDKEDIHLIMTQGDCTQAEAIECLTHHNGDVIEALKALLGEDAVPSHEQVNIAANIVPTQSTEKIDKTETETEKTNSSSNSSASVDSTVDSTVTSDTKATTPSDEVVNADQKNESSQGVTYC